MERVYINGNGNGDGHIRDADLDQGGIAIPARPPRPPVLNRLLPGVHANEMAQLLHAEFVPSLIVPSLAAPGRFLQQPLDLLPALAGYQADGLHPGYCLYRPAIPRSATQPECSPAQAGEIRMAGVSGDLGFLYDGQLFAASMINDLIILCGLYQNRHDIDWSPECDTRVLCRGYSMAPNATTITSGDDEFGSPSRRTLWFLREIALGATEYCIAVALCYRGELNVAALEFATNVLLGRRGIFCVTPAAGDAAPSQQITGTATALVQEHDAGDLDDARLAERLEQSVSDLFDLPCVSPLQIHLYQRISGETVILVVVHQSVADLWSITAFIRELEMLYSELAGGQPAPVPELASLTRYYSWVDGSRVSANASLDTDPPGFGGGCQNGNGEQHPA